MGSRRRPRAFAAFVVVALALVTAFMLGRASAPRDALLRRRTCGREHTTGLSLPGALGVGDVGYFNDCGSSATTAVGA
jgi:hypothetical protein